ncbi:Spx/MgsR family RNA polymerase-binding regulatory protein [Mycoplasma bradburyae]|uniref:Spx/MgsR family RNA polymerase-binding regulatory protein n=1 Tax=Mycoplasma bradburyae TaxID=2963128 RepID=A0AAW6HN12_9MOLU|nr:Spx/MgsR family RNA polymerase-binding regulatory protein [Mycoplasma bradburyae]MDC4163029.1 Spx/MgsR family RNA polymerase-binding regulatory protein [Mycoplasma bradburyae]MDC4181640.1 Spx/MgsR family RNA polymerase-binding regulatory protein [Mycoplasma bradburyae]MDC4182367.1 Spx/MgsR family RNA polymerase-binding regulatory protein [Mycoplasma bradburyae]MDC4183094.1 Spx/MgsR family RNA polymerase-binding regulatory protein [Mycoplasma bradburyae]MDC4183812.1 Spx/MgsR family RNA polym
MSDITNNQQDNIVLFITASCIGCTRVRRFFKENNINHKEINFYKNPIDEKYFKDILSLTEKGVFDIISTRSKYLQNNKVNIDELTISQLIDLVHEHPSILKRPIILQYDKSGIPKRLMIGYNSTDIKVFLRDVADVKAYYLDEYWFDEQSSLNTKKEDE